MIDSCGTVHYQLNSSQHNCIQYADYNLQLYHEYKANKKEHFFIDRCYNLVNNKFRDVYLSNQVWNIVNLYVSSTVDLPGKCQTV